MRTMIGFDLCRQPNGWFAHPCGLVVLPYVFPVALDLLWLTFVQRGKRRISVFVRAKQFIKFGLDGLGVAVFGPLNEQRHE